MLTIVFKEGWRDFSEGTTQVGPQSFGRLVGDLDGVLKDSDWEVFGRHGGQEESEIIVDVVRLLLHVLDHVLHRQHPGRRQVAVLGQQRKANFY